MPSELSRRTSYRPCPARGKDCVCVLLWGGNTTKEESAFRLFSDQPQAVLLGFFKPDKNPSILPWLDCAQRLRHLTSRLTHATVTSWEQYLTSLEALPAADVLHTPTQHRAVVSRQVRSWLWKKDENSTTPHRIPAAPTHSATHKLYMLKPRALLCSRMNIGQLHQRSTLS